ncbi:hypothetical protein DFH06DRAFT_1308876 [Mycena polygramma]|nr:hypothetical protein DFH06DRAFT_1308876 [Mycena polygramma]
MHLLEIHWQRRGKNKLHVTRPRQDPGSNGVPRSTHELSRATQSGGVAIGQGTWQSWSELKSGVLIDTHLKAVGTRAAADSSRRRAEWGEEMGRTLRHGMQVLEVNRCKTPWKRRKTFRVDGRLVQAPRSEDPHATHLLYRGQDSQISPSPRPISLYSMSASHPWENTARPESPRRNNRDSYLSKQPLGRFLSCYWENWDATEYFETYDLEPCAAEVVLKNILRVPGDVVPIAHVPDALEITFFFEAGGKYYMLNSNSDTLRHFGVHANLRSPTHHASEPASTLSGSREPDSLSMGAMTRSAAVERGRNEIRIHTGPTATPVPTSNSPRVTVRRERRRRETPSKATSLRGGASDGKTRRRVSPNEHNLICSTNLTDAALPSMIILAFHNSVVTASLSQKATTYTTHASLRNCVATFHDSGRLGRDLTGGAPRRILTPGHSSSTPCMRHTTSCSMTPKLKKDLADRASSTLEAALGALDLLSTVTVNVPYLRLIAGCIKKLIEIRNTMQHNKELACQLFVTVGDLTELVARGLHDLDTANRETAMTHLEDDLKRYQSIVKDTADILAEWTSMAWIKRAWKCGDFADIAASIDRKLCSFRDVFSLARLIDLSKGQNDLKLKMCGFTYFGCRLDFVFLFNCRGQVITQGVRQNLKEWLKPTNVGASHRSAAAARHPGSGLWLLEESTQFREWMYSPNSFLWLYGISGSGKTVLSLHALWKSYADRQWQGLPADSTLISKALIPLLREFNEPVYIVLDALDEAFDRRQKLLDSITDIVDAQLPNVRLLVTSRAEVLFKAPLADRGVAVSLDGCVDRDIECVVDATLSEETEWPAARKAAVKTKLLRRSSGMQSRLDPIKDGCSHLWHAASLPDFYDRILKDIKNPEMVSNVCRTIFWLIASRRPMQLVELVDAPAFDFGNKPLRFDRNARMSASVLVAACAGFISISDDVVKIAHSSVTEYFLSSRKFKDSLDGYADVQFNSAHFLLAQTCVAYLCSLDPGILFKTIPSDYALGEYASENWGFHAKLVLDLPPDADEDVQQDLSVSARTELLDRIFELLVPGSLQYISLCRLQKQPGSTPPLFVAAYSGIYAVLVELLKGGADVNTRQGPNGSALRAASARGHTRIVQLLLKRGADVNMEEVSGNALQAASTRGHAEIVQLLLENGANVNVNAVSNKALHAASAGVQLSVATAQLLPKNEAGVNAKGGEFSSALKAASARGHTEIVNLLLRHGADPNADGGISGTALQVASAFGHTEIVHLLLEKGADMNVAGGRAGNALVASSAAGHTEIVQLLLDNGADANAGAAEQGDALQVACAIGHTEIVQLLLKNGASVNAKGGEFGTALQAASARGHTGIVHLLVENGAEVNKRAEGVHNALQVASANT